MTARKRPAKKRAYRMGARAEAAERTGQAIQAAATELFRALPFDHVTLEAVAERSGVTLQTVLRRFGSKQGLLEASARAAMEATRANRAVAAPNDVRKSLAVLLSSYEEMGDLGWRALCQEEEFEFLREVLAGARALHREWLESAFPDALACVRGAERERRLMLLFASTDYYVFKLYRRDLGYGKQRTLELMIALTAATLASFGSVARAP